MLLPRPARRVVAQAMRERVDPAGTAPWRGRRRRARRHWRVNSSNIGDRIGARPFAERPTPCTSRPSPRSPAAPAPSSCASRTTACGPVARKPSRRCEPSGSVTSMPPLSEPPVDLVEHLGEGGRSEPRNESAAGREAAVGAHQMLAARAHDGASYELGRSLSSGTRKSAELDARPAERTRRRSAGPSDRRGRFDIGPCGIRDQTRKARTCASRLAAAARRGSSRPQRLDAGIEPTWPTPRANRTCRSRRAVGAAPRPSRASRRRAAAARRRSPRRLDADACARLARRTASTRALIGEVEGDVEQHRR